MPDNSEKRGLTKSRIFLLIFFGIALLLSITTIIGTWDEQKNGVVDPSVGNLPGAATTPASK